MAAGDVTSELMKAMRADMNRIADKLDRMEAELQSIRGHVATLVQSDLYRGNEVGRLTSRVERIGRRLDLHDPAI